MPHVPKKRRGFSLIEVSIGCVVLMFIIIPSIASVANSLHIVDKARDVTLASSMMESLVEQMRMQTYAAVCTKYCGTGVPTVGTTYNYTSAQFATDLGKENFTSQASKQFTITGQFTSQATGQLYVQVTASWKDLEKHPQSHTLFTIISDGGLSDNVNKGW